MKSWVVISWSIVACLLLGAASCTSAQQRFLTRGDATATDYLFFPNREVPAGTSHRELISAPSVAFERDFVSRFPFESLADLMRATKTQALLVIRGSQVLVESYERDRTRESVVTSFSIAKSFASAMVGQLIAQKKLQGLDQPISDWVPELVERDARFRQITLRDLLRMSSGIRYEEFPSLRADNIETYYQTDLRELALTKTEIGESPGLRFHYNNFNPLLLGLVIERASGTSVSDYLSQSVWAPMGAEAPATWSLDSDLRGFEKMESGLNARPIDFARFACLVRDGGVVDGKQVLPELWMKDALSDAGTAVADYYQDAFGKKIQTAVQGGYYGLGWYGLRRDDFPSEDVFAAGNKGQILYISRAADLVIVRFGHEDGLDFWKWIQVFYDLSSEVATTDLGP